MWPREMICLKVFCASFYMASCADIPWIGILWSYFKNLILWNGTLYYFSGTEIAFFLSSVSWIFWMVFLFITIYSLSLQPKCVLPVLHVPPTSLPPSPPLPFSPFPLHGLRCNSMRLLACSAVGVVSGDVGGASGPADMVTACITIAAAAVAVKGGTVWSVVASVCHNKRRDCLTRPNDESRPFSPALIAFSYSWSVPTA